MSCNLRNILYIMALKNSNANLFQNHRRSREQPPLWGWQVPPGMGNDLNINVLIKQYIFQDIMQAFKAGEKGESCDYFRKQCRKDKVLRAKIILTSHKLFLLADLWINDLIMTDLKWFYHQHLVAIRTKILGLVFYVVYDLFLRNLKDLSEQKLNTMYYLTYLISVLYTRRSQGLYLKVKP